LTYTSGNPPGSQFTFDSQPPFLIIDEETTVIVTLQNATFVADNPITWISPSTGFPLILDSESQISIDISDPPPHYFAPWILSFNVNVEGANGVTSPTFWLVRKPDQPASTSITLQYSPGDGSFTLPAATGSLANLSILTNNITPFSVTFNLVTDPSDPSVTFDSTTPLLGPSWLTQLDDSHKNLTISIPSTPDKFTSLRFVLDVGTVKVTSPDPILVNATIGDG
jgi:hypothetical protein